MTIRERIQKIKQDGEREEVIDLLGVRAVVRGSADTELMNKTILLSEEDAKSKAVELTRKLKAHFGIEGKEIPPSEVGNIVLVSECVKPEDGKALSPVEVAVLYRRDFLVYMAALGAAMSVTGFVDMDTIIAGNSEASADGSGTNAVSSGQPESPPPSSPEKDGRKTKSG